MITIPVSVGELIDKLSILKVKKNKVQNPEKLIHVDKEFELLYNMSSYFLDQNDLSELYHKLVETNSKLWEVEDSLRVLEFEKKFENEFIRLARLVYHINDERYELKNRINELTSSEIREIKDYKEYK